MKALKTSLLVAAVASLALTTAVSAKAPGERGGAKLSDTERQIQRDQWFASMDTNSDGHISEAEFVAAATARAEERAKAIFACMDEHNKGEISAEEFTALAEKRAENMQQHRQAVRERIREHRVERDGKSDRKGSRSERRRQQ